MIGRIVSGAWVLAVALELWGCGSGGGGSATSGSGGGPGAPGGPGGGAAPGQPVVFYSDLESGPNTGGQDAKGAFVTLWGKHFGSTRGTSTVTIGGGAADIYPLWSDTKITFQLGPLAATGSMIVHVSGASATIGLPFTVRPGAIHFVSTTGSDGSSGTFVQPWATLVKARQTMVAGDITYAMNGVSQTTVDNYNACLSIQTDGTASSPIALVAYPGATVTVGVNSGIDFGLRIPNVGVTSHYWVISGFTLRGNAEAISLEGNGCTGWRIIANDFSTPNGTLYACVSTSAATHLKFLGNTVHDVCVNTAASVSKLYHAVYFSTDSNHIEVGWNIIRNNQSNRSIQFHSSPLGGSSGQNQFDLVVHDNWIETGRGDGINFATVDPSRGPVRAYNNVIIGIGAGPDWPEGSGDYAGIFVAASTNVGSDGTGNVECFNNTLVDCGSHGTGAAGAFNRGSGSPGLFMVLKNNIVHQSLGESYIASGSDTTHIVGMNNLFFGNGAAPAFLSNSVTADPLFVNLGGRDLHLQVGSPGIDSGVFSGILSDLDGVARPQGGSTDLGAYER